MEILNKEIHVTQISLNGNFGLHDSYTSFPKWKLVAINGKLHEIKCPKFKKLKFKNSKFKNSKFKKPKIKNSKKKRHFWSKWYTVHMNTNINNKNSDQTLRIKSISFNKNLSIFFL